MQPHPLNTEFDGFVWEQPQPPFEIISQAQADAYRDQGGFVLRDAFTSVELAPLRHELDALENQANEYLRSSNNTGPSIARVGEIVFRHHVVLQSPAAEAFSRHAVFAALCRDLIGPAARLYWDQLVYKRPGTASEFPWHQDNGYTFVQPQQYLTCWVALNDATIENGCPWIAPGLHRKGTLAHQWTDLGFSCISTPDDAYPLEVPAGSIAVFSSLTTHRTGPNLTDGIRRSYILQYAPDGARVFPRDADPHVADDPQRQYLVT